MEHCVSNKQFSVSHKTCFCTKANDEKERSPQAGGPSTAKEGNCNMQLKAMGDSALEIAFLDSI